MIQYGHGTAGYVLTFFALLAAISTCVISLAVILIVAYHLHRHHRHLKREEKVTLTIFLYIYLFTLSFTIVAISMNVQTLLSDVYGNQFDSPWCVLRGYWFFASIFGAYYEFVIQVNTSINSKNVN